MEFIECQRPSVGHMVVHDIYWESTLSVEHMADYGIYWVSTSSVEHMAINDIYWVAASSVEYMAVYEIYWVSTSSVEHMAVHDMLSRWINLKYNNHQRACHICSQLAIISVQVFIIRRRVSPT